VRRERGRLDVLACSAFTTPPDLASVAFRDDFWKQGAPMWDACHDVGLRGAYIACCEAVPLMIETAASARAEAAAAAPPAAAGADGCV
jgi:NAD(P)-dependent dehydrogenase (short-subunit alcohol dehydrogenase family)